jgi:hypothetical protein
MKGRVDAARILLFEKERKLFRNTAPKTPARDERFVQRQR